MSLSLFRDFNVQLYLFPSYTMSATHVKGSFQQQLPNQVKNSKLNFVPLTIETKPQIHSHQCETSVPVTACLSKLHQHLNPPKSSLQSNRVDEAPHTAALKSVNLISFYISLTLPGSGHWRVHHRLPATDCFQLLI